MNRLLALLALSAVSVTAAASPIDDACSNPGPGRDAGCAARQASQDLAALRQAAGAELEAARTAIEEALAFRPLDRPGPNGDFDVYFARLRETEDAFLLPHDSGPLKKSHEKWQWVYLQLREPLRRDRERVQDLPAALEKRASAAAQIRSTLQQALAPISGGSGDGLDELRREAAKLDKKLKSLEKRLKEDCRSAAEKAASALEKLLFALDGDNVGLEAKLSDGIYVGDWDDDAARKSQVERAEKSEAKDLRERRDADFEELQRSKDALKGAWAADD